MIAIEISLGPHRRAEREHLELLQNVGVVRYKIDMGACGQLLGRPGLVGYGLGLK